MSWSHPHALYASKQSKEEWSGRWLEARGLRCVMGLGRNEGVPIEEGGRLTWPFQESCMYQQLAHGHSASMRTMRLEHESRTAAQCCFAGRACATVLH